MIDLNAIGRIAAAVLCGIMLVLFGYAVGVVHGPPPRAEVTDLERQVEDCEVQVSIASAAVRTANRTFRLMGAPQTMTVNDRRAK